jgi:succinoglycan biosynthesis transport protein ExoP
MNNEKLPILSVNSGDPVPFSAETTVFPDPEEQLESGGIGFHDILFMLFRHKWKILFFTLAGLAAAAVVYLKVPPVYQSEAKLLVRYVMDRGTVDGLDGQIKTPTTWDTTLLNSEIQILTSSDLIRQVAESVSSKNSGAGSSAKSNSDNLVGAIANGLQVSLLKDTNIISVAFTSGNRNLPMPVLQELIKRYFDKHLEVHRSTDAFAFVAQETADLKKQLDQTEAELKKLRESAGIISLDEAKKDLATEIGKTQSDLDTAESELAAQEARVKDLLKSLAIPENAGPAKPAQPITGDIQEKYKALIARLTQLQKTETDLLLRYTAENPIVKVKADQIASLEKERSDLETAYPALLGTVQGQPSITSDRAILAGLQSKVQALKARMIELKAKVTSIQEVAPQIEELQRKAEVEETNYKHSEASLEKARIDETLDPSRMPNISVVQTPSPAAPVKRNTEKIVLGLAGGGLFAGIAIALLIEMILDRTVKRPLEIENQLRIPLLLSIPRLNSSRRQLRLGNGGDANGTYQGNGQGLVVADRTDVLKPFYESIRDRLGLFFQVNNMTYKPKLVAVTGLSPNAGASTIASGLAGALTETCEGKVLLVDKLVSPKGFYQALSEFKQSDLDYVIFDMPSLGDTSATLPLAGFMDTVLLVVEAEKSTQKAIKRAYTQLISKTKVSLILNKSRSYGPKWLRDNF